MQASAKSERPEKTIEVRHKPVSDADIHHFITKVSDAGLEDAAVLAVAVPQGPLNAEVAHTYAADRGIFFRLFTGWQAFVDECFFWSESPHSGVATRAAERIYHRLIEFEVSPLGVEEWVRRVKGHAADSAEHVHAAVKVLSP